MNACKGVCSPLQHVSDVAGTVNQTSVHRMVAFQCCTTAALVFRALLGSVSTGYLWYPITARDTAHVYLLLSRVRDSFKRFHTRDRPDPRFTIKILHGRYSSMYLTCTRMRPLCTIWIMSPAGSPRMFMILHTSPDLDHARCMLILHIIYVHIHTHTHIYKIWCS